jgi:hypothetical protein
MFRPVDILLKQSLRSVHHNKKRDACVPVEESVRALDKHSPISLNLSRARTWELRSLSARLKGMKLADPSAQLIPVVDLPSDEALAALGVSRENWDEGRLIYRSDADALMRSFRMDYETPSIRFEEEWCELDHNGYTIRGAVAPGDVCSEMFARGAEHDDNARL